MNQFHSPISNQLNSRMNADGRTDWWNQFYYPTWKCLSVDATPKSCHLSGLERWWQMCSHEGCANIFFLFYRYADTDLWANSPQYMDVALSAQLYSWGQTRIHMRTVLLPQSLTMEGNPSRLPWKVMRGKVQNASWLLHSLDISFIIS